MATTEALFVDTGAWIALSSTRDALHARAVEAWEDIAASGARLHTSVPVVLETFTFLDRNASRDAALAWKDSLASVPRLRTIECTPADVELSWRWFSRKELYKLSAVDATSFTIMRRLKIRRAFTFDQHFATAGFLVVG